MPHQPEGLRGRDRLDRRIASARVRGRHLRAVASALAERHARSEPVGEHGGAPAELLRAGRERLRRLVERGAIAPSECDAIAGRLEHWLVHDVTTLLDRHAARRVRDIGVLEPAAVYVRGRRASISAAAGDRGGADVASELAALSSALRCAGRVDDAERLLAAYALAADDYSMFRVIALYETLAVLERAAAGDGVDAVSRKLSSVVGHERPGAPSLVVLVGGVATGKSTLAKALSHAIAAPRLVTDRVRAAVLAPIEARAGAEAVLERAWSESFDDRLYTAFLGRARDVLSSRRSCILDGCASRTHQRERAAELAREQGARLVICTCVAPRERVRERLEARDARDGVESGDWLAIAERVEESFEPVSDTEADRHLRLSTDAPVEQNVALVRAELARERRRRVAPCSEGFPAAVTFDCWNTLLQERNWPRAHALRVDALAAAAREEGVELDRSVVSAAFDAAWRRHMDLWQQGIVSGAREVARWSLEQLGLALRASVLEHLTERFQIASHSDEVTGLDGARETLTALHDAGIPMALVCDTGLTPGPVVRRHLDRNGLLELLAAELFSDEVGVPKPDRRIFEAALAACDVDPARAVHVGDLRRTDVQGARNVGMGSVRLAATHDDDAPLADADLVARSHAELLALLEHWQSFRWGAA